jgi:1-acyl-sn-glycerol-3-phosphate acyltransferase
MERSEARSARLRRRAISFPLVFVLATAGLAALPLLVLLSLTADVLGRRRWALTRCLLFFAHFLLWELIGFAFGAASWVLRPVWPGGHERWIAANRWVQTLFAHAQLNVTRRVFGLRLHIDAGDAVGPGPLIVLTRHTSFGDTALPVVLLVRAAKLRLRYVVKQELLWDPLLDIFGNRLPNAFVHRSGVDSEREIARVRRLAADLGERDGVVIFPEGTRFSEAKRARIIKRLRERGDEEGARRAEGLLHVLPPRRGGVLALLEGAPTADVVIIAHAGFEGAASFKALAAGELIRREIRIRMRRFPAAEVPRDRDAAAKWLLDRWAELDTWVGAQLGPPQA